MDENKDITYRLAKRFYNFFAGLSKSFNRTALELNFFLYKMEFGERDDDIYIISYPKSGTTLMQMILYQLTTDGEMDFEHIDDISPWIRNEAFENNKVKNIRSPRIIKSHDNYHRFDHSTKGRFIYVYRNVYDVLISNYHQNRNYKNPKLEFNDYFSYFLKPGKYNWFTFHRDWILNKKKSSILYIQYENILKDFEGTVKKIALYCNIDSKNIDMDRIKERTSFDYMKKHENKFGIKPEKNVKIYNEFIRKGQIGEGANNLTPEQMNQIESNLKEYIKPLV